MREKLTLTGYVTVRKFGGYAMPVPIQNKLLRYYCIENNFNYRLPLCEIYLPKNYMSLYATLEKEPFRGQIGMASIYMLPNNTKDFRSINNIIFEKQIRFHFLFEEISVDYKKLEEFYINSRLRFYTANKSNFSF